MTMMRAAPLAAVLAMGAFAAPASAQAPNTDFDGTWNFVLTCSVNSVTRQPAFTDRFTAEVNGGAFARSRTLRFNEGPPQVDQLRGNIQNGRMAVLVESQRANQRWTTRLEGAAANPALFEIQGGTFTPDERQVRGCQLSASLARPAPQSLAATALTRIAQVGALLQELTNRLNVTQQDLERVRAEAQQTEDRLQVDLDFARFEGNAMRTELDQRARQAAEAAQQITALTARATQAEAAATAARGEAAAAAQRATQAEAAATTARGQAAAASQRATQAEAAATAARGEAATAAQRATQAEAAANAARGEAARQQQAAQQATAGASQAAERAARAEAAAAALRTELDQARRALAEAQAQTPATPRQ